MPRLRHERGAALVEYILVWPLVLLLFLGALEMFRLMAVRQSLNTGLQQAIPCLSHYGDQAYRAECDAQQTVQSVVDNNPLTMGRATVRVQVPVDLNALSYGQVFDVVAEADVRFGFLYPFKGGPKITLRQHAVTFMDATPRYYQLWWETPLPRDPGALRQGD